MSKLEDAKIGVVAILGLLSQEERAEVISEVYEHFCHYCWREQPEHGCQCWNDE